MKVYIVGKFSTEDIDEKNPPIVVEKVFATKELAHAYMGSFSWSSNMFGKFLICIGEEVLNVC